MTSAIRKECYAECGPCGARWLLMVLPCGLDDWPKDVRCPWCREREKVFLCPTDGPSAVTEARRPRGDRA